MTRLEMQHRLATAIYASWSPIRIQMRPAGIAGPNGEQGVEVQIQPANDGMILQALVEAKLVLTKWEANDARANAIVNRILENEAKQREGDG